MTDKEIIEMAEQAGYIDLPLVTRSMELKELIAFAKLVADHEREKCAKIAEWHKQMAFDIRARGQE